VLGWQPKVTVEDGVRRTIEWFRSRPEEVRMASAAGSR
jgi:dTDP-glucose 4,6-dehydratase